MRRKEAKGRKETDPMRQLKTRNGYAYNANTMHYKVLSLPFSQCLRNLCFSS